MARATPRNLDEATTKPLATLALSRGWLRLHGAILAASCSTSDSARRQLAVDADPSFLEGLRFALRYAKPEELVEWALEIEDPRMPQLAGEAAAKAPEVLADLDLTATKAQAIWREALVRDLEAWQGPADPGVAFRSILDRLLDGAGADQTLIERLSSTSVADLGNYPRRVAVWSRVGNVARQHLIAATARGWLTQAASVRVPFAPEDELQTAILEDDKLERILDELIVNRVGAAIEIIASLSGYGQDRFLRLLRKPTARTTPLTVLDAEAIGRLVLERRWEDVSADLVRRVKSGRRDLKPALQACSDMLDWWERFTLGLSVSESEKWKRLHDLAVTLYPGGPRDEELWERAGGDDADLSTTGSGRARWRKALRDIRNGKGPTRMALLAAMMSDFPNNERVRRIAADPVFGGIADGS